MRRPSGHQPKGEVLYQMLYQDDEDGATSLPLQQGGAGSNFNGRKAGPISLPPKKEGDPPPPPPRIASASGHNRSSSLDYNLGSSRLSKVQASNYQRNTGNIQPHILPHQHQQFVRSNLDGPPVPPRYPNQYSPDSQNGRQNYDGASPTLSSTTSTPPPRSPSPRASTTTGAHHIFQTRTAAGQSSESQNTMSELSRDTKSLQISIQQYKEKNSVVARTINELHQEVSDTLEERIALEFQLEQLKSFGE